MRLILVACLSLFLVGCGTPLTRILPKLEKLEVPEELMEPPKELKIIEKPAAPQSELTRDVPPE
jgi:hypothetical protein